MENKTKVVMKNDDTEHRERVSWEEWYIDWYVRWWDNRPYCAIVLWDRIVFAMCYQLKVIQ